ncbi:MAG: ShlB/FhaC/HecB family hemolysin secretion/activation protein [Comamonadaceae bacterium]|nr:MAG: ShlB/FhaC/HecB family hemolysin secretion/activation protein [Comamonadaceae bacterium]
MKRHNRHASSWRNGVAVSFVAIAFAASALPVRSEEKPLRPAVGLESLAPSQNDQKALDERQVGPSLPASDKPAASLASASTQSLFALKRVEITGATALPAERLEGTYLRHIGHKVSLADLQTITEALNQAYREQGFHLTRAIIPPQGLAAGVLRISVIEGVVSDIVVKGDPDGTFGVASMLSPVAQETPSRRPTLERQLLLVNDRPGLRVSDTTLDEITPSSGRFRLTVTVQTWRGYTAAGIDNLGSAAIGPWQASANAALNSLILPGDTLAISGSTVPNATREMRFGRISYDAPIGFDRFRLGVSASTSHVWPGDQRRWNRTASKADTYEVRASYAPLLTQNHSIWLTGALSFVDATEQNGFGLVYKDRIKLASISADYKAHVTDGSWSYLSAMYKQALGYDGSSVDNENWISRRGASGHFSVLSGAFTHYQNLVDRWSLKLAAAGQVASGPLLISQQYYLGGNWFGRGLPGGWISGDNAIAGSAELRFDGALNSSFAKGYQLYAFVEGGATETKLQPRDLIQSIASVGAGVRVFVNEELQLGVGISKPIVYRSPTNHDRGVTFLFSLSHALRLCPTSEGIRCKS